MKIASKQPPYVVNKWINFRGNSIHSIEDMVSEVCLQLYNYLPRIVEKKTITLHYCLPHTVELRYQNEIYIETVFICCQQVVKFSLQ